MRAAVAAHSRATTTACSFSRALATARTQAQASIGALAATALATRSTFSFLATVSLARYTTSSQARAAANSPHLGLATLVTWRR